MIQALAVHKITSGKPCRQTKSRSRPRHLLHVGAADCDADCMIQALAVHKITSGKPCLSNSAAEHGFLGSWMVFRIGPPSICPL